MASLFCIASYIPPCGIVTLYIDVGGAKSCYVTEATPLPKSIYEHHYCW